MSISQKRLAGRGKLEKLLFVVFAITLLLLSGQKHIFGQTATPTPSCPAVSESLGTISTTITLPTTTTYKVWSRMKAADSTNNSYYLQIDSQCPVDIGDNSAISTSAWSWIDYKDGSTTSPVTMSLTGGTTHLVKLIGKEPGVALDKIIFTDDLSCVPSDLGDNCTASPTATIAVTLPPTVTNSPTPQPTILATPTPTVTTLLSPTPTKIPTPTLTPTAITDTTSPTLSITSPKNGASVPRKSNVTVTASASDASGIAKVLFYINNNLTCTDTTSPYSCTFKTGAAKGSSYSITATAYDKYNNTASVTVTVTSQ